jgi:hypothetical protein
MATDARITGFRIAAAPKASRRYPRGRTCVVAGCGTRLSTYNPRETCWRHADLKIPRLRGRPQGCT